MQYFQDTFLTVHGSFISAFSVSITVPLRASSFRQFHHWKDNFQNYVPMLATINYIKLFIRVYIFILFNISMQIFRMNPLQQMIGLTNYVFESIDFV